MSQFIGLKTVPVATGDQFLIFPSRNLPMGGVHIALDDPLLDPFVNPSLGGRIHTGMLFGAPAFHRIREDNGSAKTLPFGGMFRSDRYFGGAVVALQELTAPRTNTFWPNGWWGGGPMEFWAPPAPSDLLSDRSATNLYAFGAIGTRLGANSAIGLSVFAADLSRLEGVELLYPNSNGIKQRGSVTNVRVGWMQDLLSGSSAEALLLFNRVDMRHDVSYLEWVLWDEPNEDGWLSGDWKSRIEENLDISNTWGAQIKGSALLSNEWRAGGVFAANYKTHPKIPNYDLMQIPRDPGASRAFNLGVGVSRTRGPVTFAMDLVYEPIWSDTWVEAEAPTETASGKTLPVGARTIENEFEFGNAALRTGFEHAGRRIDMQLGLKVDVIRYDLDQRDHVAESRRFQSEEWQEWTGSLGLVAKFSEFDLRYTGRVLSGTGRPGVAQQWSIDRVMAEFATGADIILAPRGALTLQETLVITHQVAITLPLSR